VLRRAAFNVDDAVPWRVRNPQRGWKLTCECGRSTSGRQ
jgi:hypothetical protein